MLQLDLQLLPWILDETVQITEMGQYLLGLLNESLLEEVPGDVLHNAVRLLQALIDRHRAHLNQQPHPQVTHDAH